MKTNIPCRVHKIILMVFLSSVIFSCNSELDSNADGSDSSEVELKDKTRKDSITQLMSDFKLYDYMDFGLVPYPYVNERELGCIEPDFYKYLQVNNRNIGVPLQRFSVVSFLQSLGLFIQSECSGDFPVLIVHHGLDIDDNYKTAFSFACLESGENYALDDEFDNLYELRGANFNRTGGGQELQVWKNIHWKLYKDSVQFRRHDYVQLDSYKKNYDVEYIVYPIGRLLQVIEENNADISSFELASYSSPLSWNNDGTRGRYFTHGVAFVPHDGNDRLINDMEYRDLDYKMKAMNLGSPCPNYCDNAVILSRGIPVRSSCP